MNSKSVKFPPIPSIAPREPTCLAASLAVWCASDDPWVPREYPKIPAALLVEPYVDLGDLDPANLTQEQKTLILDKIWDEVYRPYADAVLHWENMPPVTEYPGFILSMNAEPQSFPDEVVKRSMMIYTTTALPPQNEQLHQRQKHEEGDG